MITMGPLQLKIYSIPVAVAGYWFNTESTQTLERLVAA